MDTYPTREAAEKVAGERNDVAPYIKTRITDSGQITGNFTKQQAEDVALTLKSGSLPTPIEVLEEGQYKP